MTRPALKNVKIIIDKSMNTSIGRILQFSFNLLMISIVFCICELLVSVIIFSETFYLEFALQPFRQVILL